MDEFIKSAADLFNYLAGHELVQGVLAFVTHTGPWQMLLCFFCCALVMIHRLNAVERNGFEGTVIGTLIMPYFSGFPNLCFAWFLINTSGGGSLVLENCLVNNITNVTLILGIPALIWGLRLGTGDSLGKINRLSLLLSLLALVFFCSAVFLVSKDGRITAWDGMLLVAVFGFWQLFHIFEVLKTHTRDARRMKKRIIVDLALVGVCAWGVFASVEFLVDWVMVRGSGFFSKANLGLVSGLFMVVPNAFLAFYYAAAGRGEIAYASQIGDCHICIPLCIGVFAIFTPIKVTPDLTLALAILSGAGLAHFVVTAFAGRLPRAAGVLLTGLYAFFLYREVI